MAKKPAKKEQEVAVVGGARKMTRAEKRDERRAMAESIREQISAGYPEAVRRVQRPFTEGDFEQIIEAIASGDTLTRKSYELGLVPAQFLNYVDADDRAGPSGVQARLRYEGARKNQAESWADGLVDLVKKPIAYSFEGASAEVAHRNLEFGVKKWLMGKYHVGKFGDKQTTVLEGNPDAPVVTHNLNANADASELIRELNLRHRRVRAA